MKKLLLKLGVSGGLIVPVLASGYVDAGVPASVQFRAYLNMYATYYLPSALPVALIIIVLNFVIFRTERVKKSKVKGIIFTLVLLADVVVLCMVTPFVNLFIADR
jgi:hypothetical protein